MTRGTTHQNRLRRIDRWLVASAARVLRSHRHPVVVDLGFGAHPVTTLELADRLQAVNPRVEVVGVDIDPERVTSAARYRRPGVRFVHGGFEVPLSNHPAEPGPDGPVVLIRAANVLRQYPREYVADAWHRLCTRISPDGLVVDATCDEIGRRCCWVSLDRTGPRALTVSLALAGLDLPSEVAARLPKLLIHDNVPGQPIHRYLTALDAAWVRASALGTFGAQQRFLATVRAVAEQGWPVLDGPRRWRLGEVSVAWPVVAPPG